MTAAAGWAPRREAARAAQDRSTPPPGLGRRPGRLLAQLASRLCCRPAARPAGAPESPSRRKGDPSPEARIPEAFGDAQLPFARVEFAEAEDPRQTEVRIVACDGPVTEEGAVALLELLASLPEVTQAPAGFVLSFDLRECRQLDLVSRVACWSREPGRATWRFECAYWKVIVSEGISFCMAWWSLHYAYYQYPPMCLMYLCTNPDCNLDKEAVCFPASTAEAQVIGATPQTPQSLAGMPGGDALPERISVGFAEVVQGYCGRQDAGFLTISGLDRAITQDGVSEMLDFIDAFVNSERAARGFSITYDLRALRAPSLSLLAEVARWGRDPWRQEKWERLNHTCKVVISPGIRHALCKTTLSSFFLLCPPVCRTLLLTDPDEAEETATVFLPPGAERPPAPGSDSWAAGAGAVDWEEAECEQQDNSVAPAVPAEDPYALWLLPCHAGA